MKILIAGYGFVGKAIANALKDEHYVVAIDPQYNDHKIEDNTDADGIIICVGTPSAMLGECNPTDVYNVISQVPVHMPILIKSTVTPDITDEIKTLFPNHSVCYSPEFLTAANANNDFLNQKFMVIGGDDPEGIWQEIFRSVLKKCNLFFNCTPTEACMVKYTINSFLATKVAFFNQIYEVCESNGADYDIVRQIVSHDDRIGRSHTLVPGPDGKRGFGGHCFPKDTWAFTRYAPKLLSILQHVIGYNDKIKR